MDTAITFGIVVLALLGVGYGFYRHLMNEGGCGEGGCEACGQHGHCEQEPPLWDIGQADNMGDTQNVEKTNEVARERRPVDDE